MFWRPREKSNSNSMITMKYKDYLQRVLFEEFGARCVYVRLENVLAEMALRADYPPASRRLLSEALLLAALMSSGLKFSGRISLQVRGPGPLRLLVADCTDQGGLRATASGSADSLEESASLIEAVGADAVLTLTLDPAERGQRWQGVVPLEGDNLAAALASYFARSEQLPTRFRLAVNESCAAALMIQRMPGSADDADGWNRLQHLLASASSAELLGLDGEALMQRLFHAEARRVYPPRALDFQCPCSRERVANVLVSLGPDELQAMVAEPEPVEVRCQFCNQVYRFDALDLAALQQGEAGELGDTVH